MKKKVLFLIHDLGEGGAEKVLINLVNNMDYSKFEITVMTLFDCGVNRQFLNSEIRYKTWCSKMIPSNSHLMKLLSPQQLHELIIKDHYDIEVSYLEGPCARVVSGCKDKNIKLISWIHCTMHSKKELAGSFRSYKEAQRSYGCFDTMVYVSEESKNAFLQNCLNNSEHKVLYNTNDSKKILEKAKEKLKAEETLSNRINWCGMGKLVPLKAFDRMLRIQKKLIDEGYNVHFYALGMGPQKKELEQLTIELGIQDYVTFLGYQTNPYKYLVKMDLFVCASYSEGFSTAATEALILGIPVCTVNVSGMREMLGEGNEYGVVTLNDEEALYQGVKRLLGDSLVLDYYKKKAQERGQFFCTENTVKAVENVFESLLENSYE